MKNSILLLACGLFFYSSNAQTAEPVQVSKKGYLGATIGLSLPTGNFGSTDFNNAQAGLANAGFAYSLCFAYKLGVNFGLAAEFKHLSNPMDEETVTEAVLHSAGSYWKANVGNWTTSWTMGGLYGSFSKKNRTEFTIKFLLGPVSGNSPEVNLTNGSNWVNQSSDNSSGFGYLVGCGMKANINENLSFLAGIDFMHTAIDFETNASNSVGYEEVNTFTQYISSALLSVGFAVRI